jgi:plastocyanin
MLDASEFQFQPTSITVPAGQPVTFQLTNSGQFPHNLHIEGQGVVFDLVPGGINVNPGQTTSGTFTFTTAGTYDFWCPVGNHRQRGMVGTLTVTAAAGAPAPVQTPGALPRTGDATTAAPGGALLGGALLVGLGWLLRRRGERA